MTPPLHLVLLLSVILSLASGRAVATDLIVERAYFEDASGAMGFDVVQHMPFTPSGKVIIRGFTRSTLWVRLTVNQPVTNLPLVLSVKPATLRQVTLFSPGAPGADSPPGIELRPTRLWRHEWVDTTPGVQVRYLRVRSTAAMMVLAEVATEHDAAAAESYRNVFLGLVLGCISPIMMVGLVLLAIQREPIVLAGFVTLLGSVLVYVQMFGYVQDFATVATVLSREGALYLSVMMNMAGGYLLIYFILDKGHMPRWGRRMTAAVSAVMLALTIAAFAVDLQVVFRLAFFTMLVGWPIHSVLSLWAPRGIGARSWFIRAVTLVISLFGVQACMQQLGLTQPHDWALELFAWRTLVSPVMFCLIIWMLEVERRDRIACAVTAEKEAREEAHVASERRSLQERLVTTLMHEIKTPLSTIQSAAASLHRGSGESETHAKRLQSIHHSVDDLNALVERCVQVDQFEQDGLQLYTQYFSLADLLSDLRESMGDDTTVVSGDPSPLVKIDYLGARVILLNLLGNARKYSPPGGAVSCEIEPAERQGCPALRVRVSNEIGVAGVPDPLKVFSRYYRSEGARRLSGAGLGLWLSQQTAHAMGTDIVCSVNDSRVCFDLWLESA
jgi:signal transduction histidine kinase